jgi:hypothetical protein
MRTWRTTVSSALAVVLATGLSTGAVLAQADEAQPTVGPLSATIVDFVEVDDMVWVPGSSHGRLDEWRMVVDVEASDPRLAGTWKVVQNGGEFGGIIFEYGLLPVPELPAG